jgi:CheY-like chemotaxis protein
VLVAEDNEALRRVAVHQLKSFGYRTFEAADGMQALALLRGSAAIDLLYTDVVMPGLDGRALAEEARQLRPGIKILFTSGFTPGYGSDSGDHDLLTPLLPKPCTKEQLAKAIRAALDDEPSANRGNAARPRSSAASRESAAATNAVPARLS